MRIVRQRSATAPLTLARNLGQLPSRSRQGSARAAHEYLAMSDNVALEAASTFSMSLPCSPTFAPAARAELLLDRQGANVSDPSKIDGTLVQWGERLFYPHNRIVKVGPQPRLVGNLAQRAAMIRSRIEATVVRRAPQVMVKVTGGGRGMKTIAAHFRYISKNGRLDIEDEHGQVSNGREAVRELAEDPGRRAAMGRQGRRYVEEHFDRRRLAQQYLAVLRDVVARNVSARA